RESAQRTDAESLPAAVGRDHIDVERGEPRQHGFHEALMSAGAIGKGRQTWPIGFRRGCHCFNAGPAPAGLCHLPPLIFMTRRPFSGRSGALSSRGISIGPSSSTEFAGTSSPAISASGSLLSKRSSSLMVTS